MTKVESPFMNEVRRFENIKFIRDLEINLESGNHLVLDVLN
jgi:hypothetical protein